jgi:hypothetical protein
VGLQAALNMASCGAHIVVTPGVPYGSLIYPATVCPASNPVLVENAAIASLPEWQFPNQSLEGGPTAVTVATSTMAPALQILDGAAGVYFAGIEFTATATAPPIYTLVAMGENTATIAALPQYIAFDRCWVHPGPTITSYVDRGIDLNAVNGAAIAVNIHDIVNPGQDTQAIAEMNTPGPTLVALSRLSSTGENMMLNTECTFIVNGNKGSTGFVAGDIGIPTCPPPSDATVRRNLFVKLAAWRTLPAGCGAAAGQPECYDVKNFFEIKHGQRVLLDANVFDTTFAEGQAEGIIANIIYPGIYVAQDFTITNNLMIHAPQFAAFAGNGLPTLSTTCGAAGQPACTIQAGVRILVRNNIAIDIDSLTWGGAGISFQIQNTSSVTLDHNTVINYPFYINGLNFSDAPPSTDALFEDTNSIQYGSPFADATSPGSAIGQLPAAVLGGTLMVGDYWGYPGLFTGNTPAYPAGTIISLSSPAVEGTGNPPITCANSNNKPIATCWPLDWAMVGFTDFAGGNAGTNLAGLTLLSTSPYAKAGTDGQDLGANVAAVMAAIAGIPVP